MTVSIDNRMVGHVVTMMHILALHKQTLKIITVLEHNLRIIINRLCYIIKIYFDKKNMYRQRV